MHDNSLLNQGSSNNQSASSNHNQTFDFDNLLEYPNHIVVLDTPPSILVHLCEGTIYCISYCISYLLLLSTSSCMTDLGAVHCFDTNWHK